MGILRGGRRCTGELGGVYWGLGGKAGTLRDRG